MRRVSLLVVGLMCLVGTALAPAMSSPVAAAGAWHLLNVPHAAGRYYGESACPTNRSCLVLVTTFGHAGVMVTTNEGRTWRNATMAGSPSGLEALSCESATVCVAVGFRGSLESKSSVVLERSVNAGLSFEPVALPESLVAPAQGDQLEAVACSTDSTCVAVGQVTTSGAPPGCTPPMCTYNQPYVTYGTVVLTSSDAGATWSMSTPNGQFSDAYYAACSSAGLCQVVGIGMTACTATGNGSTRCGAAGAALGESAASLPTSTPPTSGGASPPWFAEVVPRGVFALNGVTCLSATQCLAVGQSADSTLGHGVVLSTLNAGQRWRALAPPTNSNSLMSIACLSSRVCVVTGGWGRQYEPVVYETANGGASWRIIARFPALSNLVRTSCAPGGFCLTSGTVGIGPREYGVLVAN